MDIYISCIQEDDKKPRIQAFLSEHDACSHIYNTIKKEIRIDLRLGYDALNIFQQYWWGQADPLYALLSRRGNSVDWVTVSATAEEIDRLTKLCYHILEDIEHDGETELPDNNPDVDAHHRVAQSYLDQLRKIHLHLPNSLEDLENWAAKNNGPVFSITSISVSPMD